jgi:hypothetical protein
MVQKGHIQTLKEELLMNKYLLAIVFVFMYGAASAAESMHTFYPKTRQEESEYLREYEYNKESIATSSYVDLVINDVSKFHGILYNRQSVSSGSPTIEIRYAEIIGGTVVATASITEDIIYFIKPYAEKATIRITNSVATNITLTANITLFVDRVSVLYDASGNPLFTPTNPGYTSSNVTEASAAAILAQLAEINTKVDQISVNILAVEAQLVTNNMEYIWEEMAFVTASSVAATVVATGSHIVFIQNFHTTGNIYVRKNATAVYGKRGVLIPPQNGLYTCLGWLVSGDTLSYVAADAGRCMGFYKRKKI